MTDTTIETDAWTQTALAALIGMQSDDGGWPYRSGQHSSGEPTALAALAVHWLEPDAPSLAAAATWLQARQRSDGFFTTSPAVTQPGWMTPWMAMALARLGDDDAAGAAAEALRGVPVHTFRDLLSGVLYNYDTTLAGFPWTPGDFSFVEPTCLAMIFLKQMGDGSSDRVREAARFLRDRAIPEGGWNYGEPGVLGGTLFPAVVPTAMSLMALADEPDAITDKALLWLKAQREVLTSLLSLAWAAVALRMTRQWDANGQADVMHHWQEADLTRRGPMETALCLMAVADGGDHPLEVA